MEDILENLILRAFNNVIEPGQFLCALVQANLRNGVTDLSALLYFSKLTLKYLFYFKRTHNVALQSHLCAYEPRQPQIPI